MVHTLHGCETVHDFWSAVVKCVNNILEIGIIEGPALCILSILPMEADLSSQVCSWVKVDLITGRSVVLRHWKVII